MLAARGLKDSPLFTVNEVPLDEDGLLPAGEVAEIRSWLTELGADADARAEMVQQTIEGAIRSLTRRAHTVADACLEQVGGRRAAPRQRRRGVRRGDPRGSSRPPPTAPCCAVRCWCAGRSSWGPASCCRVLEAKVGRFRDRMVNAIKGKPAQAERVTVAVESSLETLILEHAEAAAERPRRRGRAWRPASQLLADVGEDLGRRAAGCGARRSVRSATGSRTCWRWSAPRAPTSAAPRASWPTASTGCRWR